MRRIAAALLLAVTVTVGAGAASPARAATTVSVRLRAAVKNLPVAAEHPAGYARDKFKLWIDADGDCQNTRAEVLVAESQVKTTGGCTIKTGRWYSYYDARTWTQASSLDIDHLVPLEEAWASGAKSWTAGTRQRYANDLGDPRTLVAVTSSVNRSKGDRDPAGWMPDHGRCKYTRQWVAVKIRWSLTVDPAEKKKLTSLAANCPNIIITVTKATIVKAGTTGSGGTGSGSGGSSSTTTVPVRFTKIVYNSPGSDNGSNASLNGEWARVTNKGAKARALTGWTIRDASGHVYGFGTFILKAGASVRLHTGHGTNTATDRYWNQSQYVWNNTGDKAILKNKAGTRIDVCSWGNGPGSTTC